MEVEIEGFGKLKIKNLVFDFNGTLAVQGSVSDETRKLIWEVLKRGFKVFVLTCDTFGTVKKTLDEFLKDEHFKICIFPKEESGIKKRKFVEELGADESCCFGNGNVDIEMCKVARFSVGVLEGEGIFCKLISHIDILTKSAEDALLLFLNPQRIRAGVRN